MDLVLVLVSFAILLAGAELFTNGIEWAGHRLELGEGAVGSVLAAVGTALPETAIPVIAILLGGSAAEQVGVGAILGAPFMLATLAMFITGAVVLAVRRGRATGSTLQIEPGIVAYDFKVFAMLYAVAIVTAAVPPSFAWVRPAVAIVLIGGYGLYVRAHLRAEASRGQKQPAPLRMHRLDARMAEREHLPRLRIIAIQVAAASALIVLGAVIFVGALTRLASNLGVSEALLALVIAPIATELPEAFNAIIWVRKGRDGLAVGNVSGAMVFQAAVPVSVALLFAPTAWAITAESAVAFGSAVITFASVAAIALPMIRSGRLTGGRLLIGGAFYVIYVALVAVSLLRT